MIKNTFKQALLFFGLLLLVVACGTKKDVDAFREAKYNLVGVNEIHLNGIDLLNKKKPEDFSFSDAAILFSAVSENKLAASSKLALDVKLPEGSQERSMTVTQLKWQLLVNGTNTAQGIVSEPVELHEGLNTISVSSPVILASENGSPSITHLMRLATLFSKADAADKPKITLQIKPTIQTSVGPFEVPAFINIKN
ncbi:hypothetical protein FVR03_01510 [Pontibacter qinzhouensis]|uniref:Lipoprotein n=1 Tax=Pontibacter qinzhouensis TaxID=2603253 RepID=A0A5C8KDX6_9BACT|nr:hypothetical protein [Pontibacter qinzhouensis]TXK52421.1 hypothetical protein FVR03_01510 [Pontibacter qinzhouensis]